ncbi:exported hypothetical protein [uncultured Desulfovibrio sp.]|uniref:Uncharacterized protein n=1 Tax=uncultured Desulfovibrio sp. TaxID=167968 RepID=A0A212JM51_9BACT|nr:exported hypothetical protein [uncultured Desulfovibrio sp.]
MRMINPFLSNRLKACVNALCVILSSLRMSSLNRVGFSSRIVRIITDHLFATWSKNDRAAQSAKKTVSTFCVIAVYSCISTHLKVRN